jgi:hypothetical protein
MQAGSTIVGNAAASGNNTLILGGTANAVFDVASIGAAAQYQNFNVFEKTGTSTWALTDTGTTATPWTIQLCTLQIGNGGMSGSLLGDVTDNGTLAFDRSDALTFDNVISGTGTVSQAGTGNTNVMAGALAIGDEAHTGASIVSGLTTVAAGASLGGYGTVTGSVDNSGTMAAANALASFASGNTGTM